MNDTIDITGVIVIGDKLLPVSVTPAIFMDSMTPAIYLSLVTTPHAAGSAGGGGICIFCGEVWLRARDQRQDVRLKDRQETSEKRLEKRREAKELRDKM